MDIVLPPSVSENTPVLGDGRYYLSQQIGAGGMAAVYRAWDSRLRVWRAVKLLLTKGAGDERVQERFEAEAHALARFEHPNLIRVYDVGTEGLRPYLVMELVEGGSLEQWRLRFGAMAPRQALSALAQITAGVAVAHEHGVVHRDIKPHNVLISVDGTCKLSDFGIAQQPNRSLTEPGTAMGTLGYMAPEQRHDATTVDHRADIYGLGATLWAVLTGAPAFDLFAAASHPEVLDGAPEILRPLFLRCCAYRREDRYCSAALLERSLRSLIPRLPEDPVGSLPLTALVQDVGETFSDDPTAHTELDLPNLPDATAPVPRVVPYFMPSTDDQIEDPTYVKAADQVQSDPEDLVIGVEGTHNLGDRVVEREPSPGLDPGLALDLGLPDPGSLAGKDPPRDLLPSSSGRGVAFEPPRLSGAELPALLHEPQELLHGCLSLASIPIALGLAGATLIVIVVMVMFVVGGTRLHNAALSAMGSKAELYQILSEDQRIRQWLAVEADPSLDEAYILWMETSREPMRIRAARHFLDRVQQVRSVRGFPREEDQLLRSLDIAQAHYEEDLSVWSERAAEIPSRIVIFVGAGREPLE